jgi:hypothetical protein
MSTDAELEADYPLIAWREPIHVTVGHTTRLACRYCIAHYGLAAKDVDRLYDPQGYTAHLEAFHPC